MEMEATVSNRGIRWTPLIRLIVSIGAALAITSLGLSQPITGPLINALSILTVKPLCLEMARGPQTVTIPGAFLAMMSWPQLATAIAGGLLAFGVLRARNGELQSKNL